MLVSFGESGGTALQVRRAKPRFGLFDVDPASGELRKDGVTGKLQEQVLPSPGCPSGPGRGVVPREELQKRLWPQDTSTDFVRD